VRGGLQAVPKGQLEAAATLGLSYWQTQRKIVLPPAVAMGTPWPRTPATDSARSTARAMASAASSMLEMVAPFTPRDWT